MIRIGNAIVNESEIAAIYPNHHEDRKIFIMTKHGDVVYTAASLKEAESALIEAGALDIESDTMLAMRLFTDGYRWIARDDAGEICAYESAPERCPFTWSAVTGMTERINRASFSFVTWQDDPLNLFRFLTDDA